MSDAVSLKLGWAFLIEGKQRRFMTDLSFLNLSLNCSALLDFLPLLCFELKVEGAALWVGRV